MKPIEEAARELLSTVEATGPIETVFVLKRTGVHLASWSKRSVALEVVPVMAAAAVGAVDSLFEAFDSPSPRQILMEADGRRLLFTKADPQVLLVLVAPKTVAEIALRRETQRLLRALDRARGERPTVTKPSRTLPDRLTIGR